MKRILLLLTLAAGCGDGGGGPVDAGGGLFPPDAAPPADVPSLHPDAFEPEVCSVPTGGFGAATLADATAQRTMDLTGDERVRLQAYLDAPAQPGDRLEIQLFNGYGVFQTGIAPGTYTIEGAELDFQTCGLCVLIRGDVDPTTNKGRQDLFATGGTVTIDEVGPSGSGRFRGSLEAVTLQHVWIDPNTFHVEPVDDGCTTSIASASWDVPIAAGM